MLRRVFAAGLVLYGLLNIVSRAQSQTLHVGDAAPSITVKRWVKGAPVARFERNKIYVVEFWATWCEPCTASMLHLTELQKQYKQIIIIGVSTWENADNVVWPYATRMGYRMGYRIAEDGIPGHSATRFGPMWQHWMSAAHQDEIPTAFIVNRDGKIAWIGHPLEIDEPIRNIIAATWDLKSERVRVEQARIIDIAVHSITAKLATLIRKAKFDEALATLNRAIKESPTIEFDKRIYLSKLSILAILERFTDASVLATKLISGALRDKPQNLMELSRSLVNLTNGLTVERPLVFAALSAAQRADMLCKGADPDVADTLAAAYFVAGNRQEAIYAEGRAIGRCIDPAMKAELMMHYELYRK